MDKAADLGKLSVFKGDYSVTLFDADGEILEETSVQVGDNCDLRTEQFTWMLGNCTVKLRCYILLENSCQKRYEPCKVQTRYNVFSLKTSGEH